MKPRILIVDDERSMCDLLETDLRLRDFAPCCFTSAEEAFEAFCREDFEVVLTDLKMPGMDGIEFCSRLAANRPDVPVIVMTAFGSLETAIAAIRAGAYDFVTKPIELELLAVILRRAIERRQLQEQIRSLREAVERTARFEELLGESPAMQKLYDQLSQIADSRRFRADHRRERDGQGAGRPRAAPAKPAARQAVRRRQLRRPARHAPGKRTVRARQGRVHRRADRPQGAVRSGRRRDAAPGRNRRNAAGHAAEAAAGVGGEQGPAGGQRAGSALRRANPRLDQPRPGNRGGRAAVSRRPLLPHQRDPSRVAAASRPRRRRPAAGPALHRSLRRAGEEEGARHVGSRWRKSSWPIPGPATSASCAT